MLCCRGTPDCFSWGIRVHQSVKREELEPEFPSSWEDGICAPKTEKKAPLIIECVKVDWWGTSEGTPCVGYWKECTFDVWHIYIDVSSFPYPPGNNLCCKANPAKEPMKYLGFGQQNGFSSVTFAVFISFKIWTALTSKAWRILVFLTTSEMPVVLWKKYRKLWANAGLATAGE